MAFSCQGVTPDLISRQPEVDALLNKYMHNKEGSRMQMIKYGHKMFSFIHLHRMLKLLKFPPPAPSKRFRELLDNAKNLTSSWGGQLYFVYLPSRHRYANEVEPGTFYHRDQVLSIINNLNIPIIDIHEKVFAPHPDPLSLFPFGLHGHYNREGYHLVAQAIYTSLSEAW